MDLYKFENLKAFLDRNNFPEINFHNQMNLIVKEITKQAVDLGHIIFRNDGIYWIENGKEIKGFVYIAYFSVFYNSKGPTFPKFHIAKCKTIQEFLSKGRFELRYHFSTKGTVKITDISQNNQEHHLKLKFCKYCQELTGKRYQNSEEFVRTELH